MNCPMVTRSLAYSECRGDICLTGVLEKSCSIIDVLVDRCLVAIGGPPIDWRPDSNFDCRKLFGVTNFTLFFGYFYFPFFGDCVHLVYY